MTQSDQIIRSAESTLAKYSPFINEIRTRFFFAVSLFAIFAALGFIYYEKIVSLILSLFALEGLNIVFTSPFQFFSLALDCALLVGFVGSFPLLIFQLLAFLKPALSKHEYRVLMTILPIGLVLFTFGFVYGVLIMKYVLILFFRKSVELSIGNFIDVSFLLSQVVQTATLLGIASEFPIILTILMRLKMISYRQIIKQRLYVYCFCALFVVFLPPSDLFSDALLVLPLALLFEFTLVLNRYLLKTHLL